MCSARLSLTQISFSWFYAPIFLNQTGKCKVSGYAVVSIISQFLFKLV